MGFRPKDIGSALTGQIAAMLGSEIPIAIKRERPWASITFSGTRYHIEIDLTGGRGPQLAINLMRDLPDHEFELPGHFVADLLVHEHEPDDQIISIELLVIVDPVAGRKA